MRFVNELAMLPRAWARQAPGSTRARYPPWRGQSHSLTAATCWPNLSPLTACGSRITA